ncbi:cysteine--tRNA ligase [Beijerinckia indica]|uniref:Cysteine--tRNA ligase n=1 Tax=Beijerinckia indica subsp. indica (strain ATCC 9039 / DSM 1715 / NCIMB 8712) TaxID=395963 RepID=SYC_BEII9|nr:cysteine--tRNA ligase [Beijerinckia indica]B2IEE1.1 RecName: Full=Cysteine--tRNA ligase; AltName: Full=Cysteinyl-tRNA synthetase; Short=CysRS [Beijerinckia indica subsp. indica ATCC 9039]ACB95539.1 cysteinyl-tRNA synthetase [Beijerinckia indica subsp. indica ATCC 9039]
MALQLYNTLTRQKDIFEPIDPANVRLYACGPTVYDFLHIGNGRMLIVFDLLFRVLRDLYGADHVRYVRNITDVDDKINARAAERGIDIRVLTDEMTAIFHEDAKALNCLPPTVEPRATEHMAEMIAIIEKLVANGHAYIAEGHVLFDVPSMPDYGKLSKRPLDDMIAGARVEVAPYKRSPTDFVLWKPAKPEEPGWESPWGRGRPGWHLECSAMSWKHLGEVFDIHGGGIDLVFPHHENEVAQTCSAFGHDVMANVWMHNGHLQVEGQKMSKSLGNFLTIRDVLKDWPGETVRFTMLKTHYRQPIDWTLSSLRESQRELDRWYPVARAFDQINPDNIPGIPSSFRDALQDDLNTPEAITILRRLYKDALETTDYAGVHLLLCGKLLGLFDQSLEKWKNWKPASFTVENVTFEDLIKEREEARAAKNWPKSDHLRDVLASYGIVLKDNKDGTTSWEAKR